MAEEERYHYQVKDVVATGDLMGDLRECLYVALSNHLGAMWASQNGSQLLSELGSGSHLALGTRSISFDAQSLRELAGLLARDAAQRVATVPVHGEPVQLAHIYVHQFARRCERILQELNLNTAGIDLLVEEFLEMPGNGTGGTLHTVLDDSDWSDEAIDRCISAAASKTDVAAYALARLLRAMPHAERLQLAEVCPCCK